MRRIKQLLLCLLLFTLIVPALAESAPTVYSAALYRENLLYHFIEAENSYFFPVESDHVNIAHIARYEDTHIQVKAGKTYAIGCRIVPAAGNTAQQGSLCVTPRLASSNEIIGTMLSTSNWAFQTLTGNGQHDWQWLVSFEEDADIYLTFFGVNQKTGSQLNLSLSNMYMTEVDDRFTAEEAAACFLADFQPWCTPETRTVVAWGDSLTLGAGVGAGHYDEYSYPSILQTLLGSEYTVINFGVGGETSNAIMGRQGSMPIIVEPCTIPSEVIAVDVSLSARNGQPMAPTGQTAGEDRGLNPCFLNGVEGTLRYDEARDCYTFIRSKAGEMIVIDRPTALVTSAQLVDDIRQPDVLCLWIGTNDCDYSEENFSLSFCLNQIAKLRTMIDYAQCDQYIVLGMISKEVALWDEYNELLANTFGSHYINIHQYLLDYGLADCCLTPTETDLANIEQGRVPESLRSDGLHLNTHGYRVVAQQVYLRGAELGYWK